MKRLLAFGLAMVALGGGFLAIHGHRLEFSDRIPTALTSHLLAPGAMLVAIGLLTVVFWCVSLAAAHVVPARADQHFECVPARASELHALHRLYANFFGSDVPSIATMRAWHSANPHTFWVLFDVRTWPLGATDRKLVGSFKVLYVNQDIVEALEDETVTGTTIPAKDIVARDQSAAVYVGDVAATTREAKASLLAYMDSQLRASHEQGLPIYARPLTKAGFAVMRTHGFVPVSADPSANCLGRLFKLSPRTSSKRGPARGTRIVATIDSPGTGPA